MGRINKDFINKFKQASSGCSFHNLAAQMEEELLVADFGIQTTRKIISKWRSQSAHIKDTGEAIEVLGNILESLLIPVQKELVIKNTQTPFSILMVGVNGCGKTTTLAKIAAYYKDKGFSLQLAAADTFRAAATEQLQLWGNRLDIPITSGSAGADSTAVIYRGFQEAILNNKDIFMADTAGRMPNNEELKLQLCKAVMSMNKIREGAPDEIMLVLDATHGQSALMQARSFSDMVKISSICLTKLDGGAKGGVIFSLAEELKTPIRFIGVGESVDSLLEFNADKYVQELLS